MEPSERRQSKHHRTPEVMIDSKVSPFTHLRELREHRHMVAYFVRRNLQIRYKQTAIGWTWLILRPALFTIVLVAVFSRIDRFDGPSSAPYWLIVLIGIVNWTFVSASIADGSNAIVADAQLVTHVHLPLLVLPVASVLTNVFDYAILVMLVTVVASLFGNLDAAAILLVPIFMLQAIVASLAISVGLAAVSAKYRDIRYVVAFALQVGMFLSPVIYRASDLIPDRFLTAYMLNPFSGSIEGLRRALVGSDVDTRILLLSGATTVTLLFLGLVSFHRQSRDVVDVV